MTQRPPKTKTSVSTSGVSLLIAAISATVSTRGSTTRFTPNSRL